jgi:hypothetical protein
LRTTIATIIVVERWYLRALILLLFGGVTVERVVVGVIVPEFVSKNTSGTVRSAR